MKLKLYTDVNLLHLGQPVDLLIPFVGNSNEEYSEGRLYAHTFDEYCALASEYIELTSLEECDACLLPIHYNPAWSSVNHYKDEIREFIAIAEASGKKIIIFLGHDVSVVEINIRNAVLFSGAINKSTHSKNLYSYPHFFADLLFHDDATFIVRHKAEFPVVGFCGYAPPLGIKIGKRKVISSLKLVANYLGIMKRYPSKSSHSYRVRAIIALRKSKKIKTNLQIKNIFAFGPAGQLNTGNTGETDTAFRKTFTNNILESDYTLCVRGIGNNSIRFFETLCCGRIPVFINTDSVLPFDHIIDWKKMCVWVDEKDIDSVGDAVSAYHNNMSEADFIQLQGQLRQLWVEYLSPLGFYKKLRLFL